MPLCSKCGAELDESAKFCMECGTPVLQTKKCKKCGSELPSKAKFCFNCGTAQEESTFNKDPSDSETNAAELKTTKNGDVSVREKENSFTDPRDGETYKVCRIGEQIWMAENLRYRPLKGGSYPYNRDKDNVVKYGRLYEEKAIEEAIPPGWHLPEENEIEQMTAFIKKTYHIADALRSKDWDDGMDVYGFNAIPSGYYGHNYQDNLGFFNDCATYWLTSFSKRKNKWITGTFSIYHDDAYNWNNQSGYEDEDGNWISYSEKYACSIRCIKDYYHEKQKEPEDFFSKIKDIFGDASSQDKTTMASAKSTPKGHDVSVKASLNAEMGEMEMGEIKVKEGDFVSINQEVAVIMYGNGFFKNQSKPLLAPCNGTVKSILVKQYNDLTEGQIIMIITE